ncbi:hypothetical protein FKG94_28190 [Exilibacterium tricleocarpae]|uniref:Transposase n=1 Tax=Exilibacterium tricleocarpae TaxID=2591008 RepID=A0A545SLN2_9GAMM|nr:hypothetical protein FKG94_28190 [Exilibacterium tricleocarpae]
MARMPRLVVPGFPHYVTQRGNRRMKTFFTQQDYQFYLDLVGEVKQDVGVQIWAYWGSWNSLLNSISLVRTGLPIGNKAFVDYLEALTGRKLKKRKPGPKPRIR